MGKVDPTGFDAALQTIQPGQLSERQQRIAAGLAMIREQKYSISAAAHKAGIPVSTLWDYHHGYSTIGSETGFERDLKAVTESTYDIAQIAADAIRTSLTQTPEDWKPGDLVKAYGVAVDKIAILSQRSAAPVAGMTELVSALLNQGELSIRKRDPIADAVEVEAVEIG